VAGRRAASRRSTAPVKGIGDIAPGQIEHRHRRGVARVALRHEGHQPGQQHAVHRQAAGQHVHQQRVGTVGAHVVQQLDGSLLDRPRGIVAGVLQALAAGGVGILDVGPQIQCGQQRQRGHRQQQQGQGDDRPDAQRSHRQALEAARRCPTRSPRSITSFASIACITS
jgi:hypothetical protein